MFHRRHTTRVDRPSRGFTLVELVLVVMIMGVLAATAVPRFSGALHDRRAEAMARQLVSDLALARRSAMAGSTIRTVNFHSVSYVGYELIGVPRPGHYSENYLVDFGVTVGPTATLVANFDGFTSVEFDMYGRPSTRSMTASPAEPLSSGTIVVGSGGWSRTIVVDPVTGRARIQ